MPIEFIIGQIYNRRKDIHDPYRGQRQSGIVTPANYPVIFIFTGRGTRHGYNDHWTNEGTFRFFGEGQKGDMTLTKGNKAIATHIQKGKDLLLFEILGRGNIRFLGTFNCAGYSTEPSKDSEDNLRQAIVFELMPISDLNDDTGSYPPAQKPNLTIAELRQRALVAAGPPKLGNRQAAAKSYRIRSEEVRRYVLARANGICESCDQSAPFKTTAGRPYLEPHHIRRLTDGGPDDPQFMGAVCPNCHRDIHHGENGAKRNQVLQEKVTAKESVFE